MYVVKSVVSFRRVKLLVTLLSILFVGLSIFNNFEQIINEEIHKESLILLSLGCIICILSILVNGLAWKELVKWLGYKNNNVNIVYLFLKTNILKYLPGGIWHFLDRFRVLSSSIPPEQAFSSVLLEPFLMVSAALFLLPITDLNNIYLLIFFAPSVFLARRFRGYLLMQLGAMKMLQFQKIGSKFNFAQDYISPSNPSSPFPLKSFAFEILFILLKFLAFWICLKAFSIEEYIYMSSWLFAFSIAWAIGLLVPSAPGGIGIFESFILLIIGQNVPRESLLLALLSYRLLVSIADLFIPTIFILKKVIYRFIIYLNQSFIL